MAQDTVTVIFKGDDRTLSRTASNIGRTFGGVGKAIGAGLAIGATAVAALGAGAIVVGGKLTALGSDAEETASLIRTSLGPATEGYTSSLRQFASDANRSFYELQQGSSTIIAMTKSMGASQGQAADFGVEFSKISSDLGSFFNKADDEVLIDLQAALAGSSETLQKYGVDVRETSLKQMALNQGLIENASDVLPRLVRAQLIQQAIQEQASDAMGDAIRTSDSWANSTRGLQAMFTDFATDIGTQLIPAIQPLLAQFIDMAKNVLPIVAEWISVRLIPAITQLAAWLGANLPGAIKTASDYWTSTLQPAIQTVWAWMQGTLIPFLQNVLGWYFSTYLPAAIQFLSDAWTYVLQPAIVAVWEWMSTVLIPFLQEYVFPWLNEHIPQALQFLSDMWTNVLWPALQAVWQFLAVDMMPIWEALGELLGVAVPLVLTALQGIWENVLLPALTTVYNFLNDNLGPAFLWLKDEVISPVIDSLGGLTGIISSVAEGISNLAASLSNISLPDWMTPGSPTPWQIGLEGVRNELQALYRGDLPALNTSLQGLQSTTNRSTTINQNTTIYTSSVDTRAENQAGLRFALGGI